MDIITLFNQSNSCIPVKSAVLYFIQWGDTDAEKQDVFLGCLNIAHRVTPLDRGDICEQDQKFHGWAPGLEMLHPSQITWEEQGWARSSTGGVQYSAELLFVTKGHRTHKIKIALNEKIYFNFVPGAYITERGHGHRGINGPEMEVYWYLWEWGYWLPVMLVLIKAPESSQWGMSGCVLPATPLPCQVSTVPCCAWCPGRGKRIDCSMGSCSDAAPEHYLNPWGLNTCCSLTHHLKKARGNRASPRESRWWAMSHDDSVSWTWAVFKF